MKNKREKCLARIMAILMVALFAVTPLQGISATESGAGETPVTVEETSVEAFQQKSLSDSDWDFADGMILEYLGDEEEVVIPSTINGETVTGIGEMAFTWGAYITSVTIPASVTTLEENAFYNCTELTTIRFEGVPPTMGYNVFLCIGYEPTFYCHIDYEDAYSDLLDEYLGFSTGGELVTFGEPTNPPVEPEPEIGLAYTEYADGYIVSGYTGDGGAVDIPATHEGKPVVGIGDKAFDALTATVATSGRMKITSITMPDSVTFIGDYAFANCLKMASIEISPNVTSIGRNAFQYCNSLTTINVPDGVVTIGDLAFGMMSQLDRINVGDNNANYSDIDGVLFNKSGSVLINYPAGRSAANYVIPEGVEVIAADSFKLYYKDTNSNALKSVVYPSTLQEIGSRAFMQTNLESVTIYPDVVMGEYVFDQCKNIKTVTVAEGVTEINTGLLYALESCEEVILPSTLKTIGYRAFDRCGAKTIVLPEGLETIGEEAFENSQLVEVTIPASVRTIGPRAFYSTDTLKKVDFNGPGLTSIGAYAFNHCTALENVELPLSMTTLEVGAFSHCYALKSIELPNSVTTLEDAVFAGSALESIVLPDSITHMGSAVFRDCTDLKTAVLPAYLETLGTCTFEKNYVLTKVEFPKTVKINAVPVDTFFECRALREVFLPQVIEKTEACSFGNCDDKLVIKYENQDLQRSIFDVYQVNPGEFYELGEDGLYYTTAPIDEDNSNGAYAGIEDLAKDETNGKEAASQEALCGCAVGEGGVALRPSCNPIFQHVGTPVIPVPEVQVPGVPLPATPTGVGSGVGTGTGGAYPINYVVVPREGGSYVMVPANRANAVEEGYVPANPLKKIESQIAKSEGEGIPVRITREAVASTPGGSNIWLPIAIGGGVLLLGAAATAFVLVRRKQHIA